MLDVPQQDGTTLREHIENAKRNNFPLPDDYEEPPPPPPELWRVLRAWYHLSGSRSYVGDGVPLRIRDSEIEAWCRLRDEPLSPVEMQLFDVIETVWLDVMRNKGVQRS